jgi:Rrf2 family protein
MLDLAMNSKGGHISLREIASRLKLSENYLRQLFMDMRKAGLIDSVRGVGGGYFLNAHPTQISILDIIEAVEGDIFIVKCLSGNVECDRLTGCTTRTIWDRLNEAIRDKLNNLTLQELIDEYTF